MPPKMEENELSLEIVIPDMQQLKFGHVTLYKNICHRHIFHSVRRYLDVYLQNKTDFAII